MSGQDTLRQQAIAALRRLDALGLNRGSTGNLSVRDGAGMWITPTGMGAADTGPDDLVWLGWDGGARGRWQPSSEWPFHRAVYLERSDIGAIVHSHCVHATALACLERPLPPFHYMVAAAGGDSVPCVPYRLFGSEALSQLVAHALRDRDACLLAHHGLVAAGQTLAQALQLTLEIESLCEAYLKALAVAEPPRLSPAQMAEVIERFRAYGQAQPLAPAAASGTLQRHAPRAAAPVAGPASPVKRRR